MTPILFAFAALTGIVAANAPYGSASVIMIALVIYCLQAAISLFMGVSVTRAEIFFPRAIVGALPALIFWRTRRAVFELDEITYLGASFGMEWVALRFSDARCLVPFASRARRLAFFEIVQTQKPGIRIYRAC